MTGSVPGQVAVADDLAVSVHRQCVTPTSAEAIAVNDTGLVVGETVLAVGNVHAFSWTHTSGMAWW